MFKRALCIILVIMLFTVSFAFAEESGVQAFNFRLTFRMDGDVFPPSYRLRARGYAALVNRLSLDGRITWCSDTRSLDLSASLYFTDKPEVGIDFRLFGIPSRLFFTSPLIGRETVLLNMAAFLEFTVKAQNTLGIDMPWLAFLYPYCTEHSLNVLPDAWNTVVGPVAPDTEIPVEKLKQVSDAWEGLLRGDMQLNRWIAALDSLSSYPSLITDEFSSLPAYFFYDVCGSRPLTVTGGGGSEAWKNASGETICRRADDGQSASLVLTLPATENGYVPFCSLESAVDDLGKSFRVLASYQREPDGVPQDARDLPAREERAAEEGDKEETWVSDEDWIDLDEQPALPEKILEIFAAGSSLPVMIPEDSGFSLDFYMNSSVFPSFALKLLGSTKKDGSVAVSVCKPFEEASEPVIILSCEGTVLPALPESVPDFTNYWQDCHNAFSFNENTLTEFKNAVTYPLVKGLLTFVAEAPAAACQSLLDDLTDLNILDFILEQ